MTCASCVGRVERALGKVEGVQDASVNLATERAHVVIDPSLVTPQALAQAVTKAGYAPGRVVFPEPAREPQAGPDTSDLQTELTFDIDGMTCASCVRRVEKALAKVDGVAGASVNLATEQATVRFDPGSVTNDDLMNAVVRAGYGASLRTAPVLSETIDAAVARPRQKRKTLAARCGATPR
jgi:Cu+-exporting ATPase